MPSKTVVIIGAGPAGLTAGYRLLKEDTRFRVVILEESSVAGGLSRTVVLNGNRLDIGGHRFFSKDRDVNALWQELMPLQGHPSLDDRLLGREPGLSPGGPDPEKEDRVMLSRRRVSRIYYGRHFFARFPKSDVGGRPVQHFRQFFLRNIIFLPKFLNRFP